jgi:hypothetical protein
MDLLGRISFSLSSISLFLTPTLYTLTLTTTFTQKCRISIDLFSFSPNKTLFLCRGRRDNSISWITQLMLAKRRPTRVSCGILCRKLSWPADQTPFLLSRRVCATALEWVTHSVWNCQFLQFARSFSNEEKSRPAGNAKSAALADKALLCPAPSEDF